MIGRFRQHDTDAAGASPPAGGDLRLGDVLRGERATLGKSLLDVQRELKIKAAYVAAIENANPSVFETPGFIAGYVRSYARYLNLDPDWAFRAFCAESGFAPGHGMTASASGRGENPARRPREGLGDMPLALAPRSGGLLARIEPGAVGSMLVLLGLIALIGYGGYAVLTEVQKVQFVPVDQSPQVLAEIDPLSSATPPPSDEDVGSALPAAAPDRFDRLYRPEALDVPVMVARDGPIATLDPRSVGTWAGMESEASDALPIEVDPVTPVSGLVLAGLDVSGGTVPEGDASPLQVVADAAPDVVLFAVRPSWVRVRSADGTTLYERIMNEGDRFVLPKTEEPATLRTGESGAIYFSIDGEPHGPAGRPGTVTGNLPLDAPSLKAAYEVADPSRDTALARVVVELRADPPPMPGDGASAGPGG